MGTLRSYRIAGAIAEGVEPLHNASVGAAVQKGVGVEDLPIEQAYSFLCRGCGHAWSAGYEIRRVHDSRGLIQSAFFLDGRRAPSPLTQVRCVRCGGAHLQVTAHTRGRRPRGGAMMEMTP